MGNYDPDKIHPISTAKTKLGLDTNVAATLCYVPFFAVNLIAPAVWLTSEPKDNYFLRFHSAQAVVMVVGYIGLAVVLWVSTLIPFLGFVTGLLSLLLAGAFFITNFFLMYAAFKNRLVRLPVIGDVADSFLTRIDNR